MESTVLGIYARFSQPTSQEAFWRVLIEGGSCALGMSEARMALQSSLPSPNWGAPPPGMFFEDVDAFDRQLFSMAPASLVFADPRQRMLLEAVYRAIEDAGISPEQLSGKSVGVFVAHDGWYLGQYAKGMVVDRDSQEFFVPGNDPCFLANRISSTFNFTGPSIALDTTCSGALVALHHAQQTLLEGDCDFAVVAAVTLFLQPWGDGSHTATPFESNDKQMKSFQQSADGYITSEGCGALLLKSPHIQAGCHTSPYANILATAYNSGGKTASFAKPNEAQQIELFRRVLAKASIEANDVSYVEAHGVSTAIGDAIEGNAIVQTFSSNDRSMPLWVSCLKPNLGHTHAASGIYGLLKVFLSIRNRELAPIRGFSPTQINLEIVQSVAVQFVAELQPWQQDGRRIAMISGYGLSNVNAAVLVAEYKGESARQISDCIREKETTFPFCLSATGLGQLKCYAENLLQYVRTQTSQNLSEQRHCFKEFAYSLLISRPSMAVRFVATATSWQTAEALLIKFTNDDVVLEDGHCQKDEYQIVDTKKHRKEQCGVEKLSHVPPRGSESTNELIQSWLYGNFVDWRDHFEVNEAIVCRIPEYPFARKKYWIPEKFSSLDKNTVKHAGYLSGKYVRLLDGSEFYLREHVIQGQCILPAVVYLDMLIAAVELPNEDQVVEISGMVWERPLVVEKETKQVSLQLGSKQDSTFGFKILSESGGMEGVETLHGSGSYRYLTRPAMESKDLEVIKASFATGSISKSEIYDIPGYLRLYLGPSIQGIENVLVGEQQILAEIKLPECVSEESYVLHPSIMDPILQVAYLGLSMRLSPGIPLTIPFYLDECRVFTATTKHMWAWIRYAPGSSPRDRVEKLDVDLLDQKGSICLTMRGFSFRKLDALGKFQDDTNTAVDQAGAKPGIIWGDGDGDVEAFVRRCMAKHSSLDVEDILRHDSFDQMGLDSILVIRITEELASFFPRLPKTVFFENQTVSELSAYLTNNYPEDIANHFGKPVHQLASRPVVRFTKPANPYGGEIAVVGLAGRYPHADTIDEFWALLKNGVDAIEEVPDSRWDWQTYYSENRTEPGKHFSKWGGFLNDVDKFDPMFFNIAPKEAVFIDPQERLFLEQAWAALEDAGYSRALLQKQYAAKTGVYAGVMYGEYQLMAADINARSDSPLGFASTLGSIANRVSYVMGFHGPSITIDTQCSSSLTALHLARKDLLYGDTDMALAGGVNLTIHPNKYLELSRRQFVSSKGRCESFGEGGDGYVPSEGVGVAVLKRLADAEADGDHIYGLILGSALNHGGRTSGFTVPNPKAQTQLIQTALNSAGLTSDHISYVEAHGTGTVLGDPIEVSALSQAFQDVSDSRDNDCLIGSVKSNIGHCESAAGIAGLTKVLLQMKHRWIVPSLHSQTLNPNIDFTQTQFTVNQQGTFWEASNSRHQDADRLVSERIAGLSSFGAGGANAHLVLGDYRPVDCTNSECHQLYYPISAASSEALIKLAENLASFVEQSDLASADEEKEFLWRLSCTLHLGREALTKRAVIVATSKAELEQRLRTLLADDIADKQQVILVKNTSDSNLHGLVDNKNDVDHLVKHWIATQRWTDIFKLWCEGAGINLVDVWHDRPVKRMSFPTYPFARERYWISDSLEHKPLRKAKLVQLHPLIHENCSNLMVHRYRSHFSNSEKFLAEHIIQGQAVLPGAVVINMFLVAAGFATGSESLQYTHFTLFDLRWLRPAYVPDAGLTLELDVQLESVDDVMEHELAKLHMMLYRVVDDIREKVAETGLRVLHQRIVENHDSEQGDTSLCAEPLARVSGQEINSALQACGMKLGKTFQNIDYVSLLEASCTLKFVAEGVPLSTCHDGSFPDLAVDAAFQATICASSQGEKLQLDSLSLPAQVQEIQIFSKTLAFSHCKIVATALGEQIAEPTLQERDLDAKRYDIFCYSHSGELLMKLIGFVRRSQKAISADADALTTIYAKRFWQPVPEQKSQDGRSAKAAKVFSFPGIETGIGEKLAIAEIEVPETSRLSGASLDQSLVQAFKAIQDKVSRILEEAQADTDKVSRVLQLVVPQELENSFLLSLIGLCKSFNKEQNYVITQILAVTPLESVAQISASLATMALHGSASIYQRLDQVLNVQRLGLRDDAESDVETSVEDMARDAGVYILAGGAGGFGQQLVKTWLERTEQAQFVLFGRSTAAECLSRLTSSRLHYRTVDITQLEELELALSQIRCDIGPIFGVIHLAGCTRDSLFVNKSMADLQAVMQPKVNGTVNLDLATQADMLDFFVSFSSVAAVLGNPGQSDYATANAFLLHYMAYRETLRAEGQRQGISTSICWPLLEVDGMGVSAQQLTFLQNKIGMWPMPVEVAIDNFFRHLAGRENELILAYGRMEKLQAWLEESGSNKKNVEPSDLDRQVALSAVNQLLINTLATVLEIPEKRILPDMSTEKLGIDSVSVTAISTYLNQHCVPVAPADFYEFPSINALAQSIVERFPSEVSTLIAENKSGQSEAVDQVSDNDENDLQHNTDDSEAGHSLGWFKQSLSSQRSSSGSGQRQSKALDIAIVGISAEFAGAQNLQEYWAMLRSGTDATSLPSERRLALWQQQEHPCSAVLGGYLDGIEYFDNAFFGIDAEEARKMDPQERKILEHVWMAIEDAGYAPDSLQAVESKVSVFVGAMYGQYQLYGVNSDQGFASSQASIANRVSYSFDFKGSSMVVDSMCSSSGSALELACRALRSGQTDVAVVGGVNIASHPNKFTMLQQYGLLASTGKSQSLGSGSSGYVPGEGVGVLILKRLEQAKGDHDNIQAVILGSSIAHTGKSNGYRAPNPKSEAEVIVSALREAQLQADDVAYIEAHSTGTALGDRIELSALSRVFSSDTCRQQALLIGSAKANIGHCESTASIAAIAKVLLQYRYNTVPPQPYFDRQLLSQYDFEVPRTACAWPLVSGRARVAGISSFGAGGTNHHVVLRDYQPARQCNDVSTTQSYFIPLSAMSWEQLHLLVANLVDYLQDCEQTESYPSLEDIAFTLWQGRVGLACRCVIAASSMSELQRRLDDIRCNPGGVHQATLYGQPISGQETLVELVEGWLKGAALSWQELYDEQPYRVSLPTYPFSKSEHWWDRLDPQQLISEKKQTLIAAWEPCSEVIGQSALEANDRITSTFISCIAIVSQDIALDQLSISSRISELALDSLQIVRLAEVWQLRTGTTLEREWFFEARTVQNLIMVIKEHVDEASFVDSLPELQSVSTDPVSSTLSSLQEAFVVGRNIRSFGHQVSSSIYVEIDMGAEPLDISRLCASWDQLAKRHTLLRSKISASYQLETVDEAAVNIRVVDADMGERSRVRVAMKKAMLDAFSWPPYQIVVSQTAESQLIHLLIDEVFADALSVLTVVREWNTLYSEPEAALPPLACSYYQYKCLLDDLEHQAAFQQSKQYWVNKLSDMPAGPKLNHSQDKLSDTPVHCLTRAVDLHLWRKLKQLAERYDVYPSTLLLQVFGQVICEASGQAAVSLRLTNLNRLAVHPDIMNVVGMFASSSVFVAKPSDDLVGDLHNAQAQLDLDSKHSLCDSVVAMRALRAQSNPSGSLVLPVVFTSMLSPVFQSAVACPSWQLTDTHNTTPQVCLDFHVAEIRGGLELRWYVSDSLVQSGQAETLMKAYVNSLSALTQPFESRVSDVDTVVQAVAPDSSYPLTDLQTSYAIAKSGLLGKPISSHVLFEITFCDLDTRQFENALTELAKNHDILFAKFSRDGRQSQGEAKPLGFSSQVVADSMLAYDELRADLSIRLHNEVIALGASSYVEAHLIRFRNKSSVWLKIDFLVADGRSINNFVAELLCRYLGIHPVLRPSANSYWHYLARKNALPESPITVVSRTYWKQKFQSISNGPVDIEENHELLSSSHPMSTRISCLQELEQVAQALDVKLDALLLFAYGLSLRSLSQSESFSLVVPCWDRLPLVEKIDAVIGDFTRLAWVDFNCLNGNMFEEIRALDACISLDLYYGQYLSGTQVLRGIRNRAFPVVYTSILDAPELLLGKQLTAFEAADIHIVNATSNTANVVLDCVCKRISEHQLILQWDSKIANVDAVQSAFDDFVKRIIDMPERIRERLETACLSDQKSSKIVE